MPPTSMAARQCHFEDRVSVREKSQPIIQRQGFGQRLLLCRDSRPCRQQPASIEHLHFAISGAARLSTG